MLEVVLVCSTAYVVIILSWILFARQVSVLVYPSIPMIYFFFHSVFITVGAPLLFVDRGMEQPRYLFAVLLATSLFPVGCWLANRIFSFSPRDETAHYISRPLKEGAKEEVWLTVWFVFFALCAALSFMYLSKLGSIPIISIIRDAPNAEEVSSLRNAATAGFAGRYHRYSLVFYHLMPLAAYVAVIMARITKKRFWKMAAISSGVFSAFMLIATGVKGPVIIFVLTVTSFVIWMSDRRRALKILALGFVISTFLIGLIYFLVYIRTKSVAVEGFEVASKLFLMIGGRVIITQSTPLYEIFSVFPEMQDFLFGRTFTNPGGVFPFRPFRLSFFIFDLISPYATFRGSANSSYYAEIYANFGWTIMMCSMLLWGTLLQTLHIGFMRANKTVLNLLAMVSLGFLLRRVSSSSFSTLLLPLPLYIFLFVSGKFILDLLGRYKVPLRSLRRGAKV